MTIADMSTINVEVNVDETEISNVEVGQPAKVKVDALGEKEINAVVTAKESAGNRKVRHSGWSIKPGECSGSQRIQSYGRVNRKEMTDEIRNALRPGMSATATITTK